ncbi:MAG: YceI family protein [Bacteroidota bacterium]|nr:YceI family protein [Flavisolibacter sp.]MBD0375220.1 YceI family protein [Flavisolibacter sp.]MDQ3844682.1 YceI family protein [Bacteroidota bacterium]
MRTLLLYLFILFLGLYFQHNYTNATKWVIISGCSLKVDGSTNINNFSCAIANYSTPDTILVFRNGNQPVLFNGNIRLPVQNFDCHNPVMTADLRKTLKAKEFPQLIIRFISMNKYPDAGSRQDITKGIVVIELAGVSKRFEVDYKVVAADRNYINLVGSRKVNFTDFNITPPRKIGGMIQTNNELSVVFNLKMKVLD